MIDVKVYTHIANQKENIYLSMSGMEDSVFSADTVRNIFTTHPAEKEFRFNIHCDGGSVAEGLAIYDIIRSSGKTIHTHIDGACHSMAITLLLAAPKENRTANPNSRALIHPVYAAPTDYLNKEQLRDLANQVEKEENTILDIYHQRTGCPRHTLAQLMKEEKQRTAQELLKYGFISKINNYTTNKLTNKNQHTMSNKRRSITNRLMNLLSGIVNYDHADAQGNLLFSTDAEDETLEVGMPASPDGTFDLPDGRTVIIEGGIISEIAEAEETQNLRNEVRSLRNALQKALNQLQDDEKAITSLRNQVRSTHNVKNRLRTPARNGNTQSIEDMKNEIRENLKKNKKGGIA